MTTFTLPDLGEGLQEAEIVSWHVGAGDHVVADQPLLAVETEKAVVEIPSPQSGRIARLLADVGEVVRIGAPLVEFAEGEEADTGAVAGELPTAPKAAPAVRALAKDLGVVLAGLQGSGPGGAITRADVEAAAAGAAEGTEPLRGVRRAMAKAMARAGAEVVAASVTDEAEVESWFGRDDPTLRLIRAVVAGCRAAPALNAWYDGAREARRLHERIDLGIAVDTPDGLFVPVLRDVASRTEAALRAALDELKAQVRDRTIPPEAFKGQTITLSNFGPLGGRHAALVIVPPQVAILGAGRVREAVVAVAGAPALRRVLPLSLSFDHRAVTGGEAARFLAAVIADLETPS